MIPYLELKKLRMKFNSWKHSPRGRKFIKELYDKQHGKCAVSGLQMVWHKRGDKIFTYSTIYWRTATVDHIIPLSEGGKNKKSNYRLVTRAVNLELSRNNKIT